MALMMTMVLRIVDNGDDFEEVDNDNGLEGDDSGGDFEDDDNVDGEAGFEDLQIATKVLSVKIHFRNPSLWRSMQV